MSASRWICGPHILGMVIFSSNGVGSPNPPPRKLLGIQPQFPSPLGQKLTSWNVDSQMAFCFFLTRKKVMFQVFSASMSSFMGVKSTQNKTCCLAEVNLELMDDPLGPHCWRSVRQHQKNLPEMLLETVGSPWTRKEYWNLLESSLWFAGDTRRTLVTATQAIQIYWCQFRTEITLSI